MADLVVIVPTRDRPQAVLELAEAFHSTCTAATELRFAIDDDGPQRDAYYAAWNVAGGNVRVDLTSVPSRNMGEALSLAVAELMNADDPPFAIGFMGDDHRPRTKGWDTAYLDTLRELGTGIVYGNDLLQGERIPTQVAMTTDIVRALGHMAPPTLIHMYFDDYWKELGTRAGCIRYLPDVVVEHMHPVAGKAEWDPGYERVNSKQMYATDHAAYMQWKYMKMPAEVAKIRALRERPLATGGLVTPSQAVIVGEHGPKDWLRFDDDGQVVPA